MNRIQSCFEALRSQGRKALIPFLTAGDPSPEYTVPLMHAMVAAGADILELGVPFSDPMMDGLVIQKASERALIHKVSLRSVLAMVTEFRHQDSNTPVVLMGYLNPMERMGYHAFAEQAKAAGMDAALTVDLPPEEAQDLVQALVAQALDPIFLLAPTTTAERMARICDLARGFVYYVSLKGVTGAAHLDTKEVGRRLGLIREYTDLPLAAGFGIRDAATAVAVAKSADAVVVGSALVAIVERGVLAPEGIAAELSALLGSMRQALDAA